MSEQAISLNAHHIRLYRGVFYNHDFLYFASSDVDGVAVTYPIIHNYALSYAVSQRTYGISQGGMAYYALDREQELRSLPVYTTPASPLHPPKTRTFTISAFDDLRAASTSIKTVNSPTVGQIEVLDICYRTKATQQSGFLFYAFVVDPHYHLPGVFRLGKKGASIRATWEEIKNPVAKRQPYPVQLAHPVNPMDVQGELDAYQLLPMRPHLLLTQAWIKNEWVIWADHQAIHFPKLLQQAIAQ